MGCKQKDKQLLIQTAFANRQMHIIIQDLKGSYHMKAAIIKDYAQEVEISEVSKPELLEVKRILSLCKIKG